MDVAIAFPGQGSQKRGMGEDFAAEFPIARKTFEEASDALGFDLASLCFEEDERLARTEFQQPAILAVEIAMWRALSETFGLRASVLAGHSLGEYTALTVAGALPFAKALTLVRERGRLMQEAVPVGEGAMVAIIAKPLAYETLCDEATRSGVDVANDNDPNQAVLSGARAAVDAAIAALKEREDFGRFKAIPLRVSAPFHSRHMHEAAEKLRPYLEEATGAGDCKSAGIVASNATGTFHRAEASAICEAMVQQMGHTVRWRENMQLLAKAKTRVLEIGPGRPLRGFLAAAGIESASISTVAQAREALDS